LGTIANQVQIVNVVGQPERHCESRCSIHEDGRLPYYNASKQMAVLRCIDLEAFFQAKIVLLLED
jgi:hypothetical protein